MPSYTTQSKVEGYLAFNIDSAQASFIATWILAASQLIDDYCGKTFAQAAATAKYYDGNGETRLLIDDFTGTPTIAFLDNDGNVESTLASTDFWTKPYNETTKNELLISDGGDYGSFPKGKRNIRVTADFFTSSVPSPVEMACTMLVAQMVRNGIQGGKVASESLGEYSVAYEKVEEEANMLGVKAMLNPYRQLAL